MVSSRAWVRWSKASIPIKHMVVIPLLIQTSTDRQTAAAERPRRMLQKAASSPRGSSARSVKASAPLDANCVPRGPHERAPDSRQSCNQARQSEIGLVGENDPRLFYGRSPIGLRVRRTVRSGFVQGLAGEDDNLSLAAVRADQARKGRGLGEPAFPQDRLPLRPLEQWLVRTQIAIR